MALVLVSQPEAEADLLFAFGLELTLAMEQYHLSMHSFPHQAVPVLVLLLLSSSPRLGGIPLWRLFGRRIGFCLSCFEGVVLVLVLELVLEKAFNGGVRGEDGRKGEKREEVRNRPRAYSNVCLDTDNAVLVNEGVGLAD